MLLNQNYGQMLGMKVELNGEYKVGNNAAEIH